jgi:ubiquinone/menaquinone biosynthesis C-methylase UbiE
MESLTERQQRELDYHTAHAREHEELLNTPLSMDVVQRPSTRWWNAYWRMFTLLARIGVKDKRVLVVGCGYGDDAIRIAKMGANVYAFDLSYASLKIARVRAVNAGAALCFEEMPAESLTYPDNFFDVVVARDIMHHVDIPRSMAELRRVAKPGATFVVNEIYSHSITDVVRRSRLVEGFIYPAMQRLIYGPGKPYITVDERKLTERDMRLIAAPLVVDDRRYFNFLVTRLVPDRWDFTAKLDRIALKLLGPLGRLLAGRVLLTGAVWK